MTRKIWMLISLALVLGGFSLYFNRDWFAKDTIQIFHRSLPARASFFRRKGPDNSSINPVMFTFDRKVRIKTLKVIPVSSIQTNSYPHPMWDLVSESNSVPIKTFTYGMPLRGMHPEVKGLAPEPLEPGVKYRLCVDANSQKLEHDFVPEARTP